MAKNTGIIVLAGAAVAAGVGIAVATRSRAQELAVLEEDLTIEEEPTREEPTREEPIVVVVGPPGPRDDDEVAIVLPVQPVIVAPDEPVPLDEPVRIAEPVIVPVLPEEPVTVAPLLEEVPLAEVEVVASSDGDLHTYPVEDEGRVTKFEVVRFLVRNFSEQHLNVVFELVEASEQVQGIVANGAQRQTATLTKPRPLDAGREQEFGVFVRLVQEPKAAHARILVHVDGEEFLGPRVRWQNEARAIPPRVDFSDDVILAYIRSIGGITSQAGIDSVRSQLEPDSGNSRFQPGGSEYAILFEIWSGA